MAEYHRDFELLSSPVNGLLKEVMESTFVKGLQLEVKAELRLMHLDGLGQSMEMAQLIEDRNNIVHDLRENMGSRDG